jgi:spermidine synthase
VRAVRLAILAFVPALALAQPEGTRRLFEARTPFQTIFVTEEGRVRSLWSDTDEFVQGAMDLDHPERLHLEYNRISLLGAALSSGPIRSALFAGLGAGSLPGFFHRAIPEAAVEAIEIDPAMLEVARTYFGFDTRIPVHVEDARRYMQRARKRYDLVFVDCYIGKVIPRHLTTLEFLREVRGRLTRHGVVVANLQAAPLNPLFGSMIETFREVFPAVYLFNAADASNVVLVATMQKRRLGERELAEQARLFERRAGTDLGLVAATERQLYWTTPSPRPPILRDRR